VGIKADDTILAINDHYIFTIAELRESVSQLVPGSKAVVRYRHHSTILDVPVTVGAIQRFVWARDARFSLKGHEMVDGWPRNAVFAVPENDR
jgi:hypothetical protein